MKILKSQLAQIIQEEIAKILGEEEKKDKKWIQKASKEMEEEGTEGDFTKYCKGKVSQACIDRAAKEGGHPAEMALFAANTSKGKWKYPKKEKE